MTGHDVLVYGRVEAGVTRKLGGGTFDWSGYGWTCSCRESGKGYETEELAEFGADVHLIDARGGAS